MRYGENYYFIYPDGQVLMATWLNSKMDNGMYNQNNVFETRQEALLESERRTLIARIHRFRDKCNASEKQLDWQKFNQEKYFISYDVSSGDLFVSSNRITNDLNLFGYFATYSGAETAIIMFGAKIKRLFLEVA
jgi:hypothetical protein|uniref:Uncharacterized protein n=1 Tax=Siphoviridae sp. ctFNZ2 TaxID=2823572 RepID=A0A8S5LAC2_9CAUD|nr:MAG TPA: hypothetical protein [Siphoviridae sp. ctFNZ2]